ncbi:hypothetical protein Tco_0078498 [Tanacetum coccineum]
MLLLRYPPGTCVSYEMVQKKVKDESNDLSEENLRINSDVVGSLGLLNHVLKNDTDGEPDNEFEDEPEKKKLNQKVESGEE